MRTREALKGWKPTWYRRFTMDGAAIEITRRGLTFIVFDGDGSPMSYHGTATDAAEAADKLALKHGGWK